MHQALAGNEKAPYVQQMFGRIAGRYDVMNRLLSFGRDQAWRRLMADLAQVPPHGLVLDLATGTGDVGLAVLARQPSATVIGADFALPMMVVGQAKCRAAAISRLHFAAADALALPFSDASFDALLHAFLMRNIEQIEAGFAEQYRVLKPGRRVVCLEITTPSIPVVRLLSRIGFNLMAPTLARAISGHTDAYTYLPQSVQRFPTPDRLCAVMEQVGFRNVHYRLVMMGNVAIHVGTKPA